MSNAKFIVIGAALCNPMGDTHIMYTGTSLEEAKAYLELCADMMCTKGYLIEKGRIGEEEVNLGFTQFLACYRFTLGTDVRYYKLFSIH